MYNFVQFIGRIVDEPDIKELENEKKVGNIKLAVQRSYKNAEGVFEADFIDVVLWNAMAQRAGEYCHKGDLIAVRGQLRNNNYEKEDGTKEYSNSVIADKILFLSKKKETIEQENDEVER